MTDRERGPDTPPGRRARASVRLLVAALAVQLLLAGLLIWAVAGGGSVLRDLVGAAPSRPTTPLPARPGPATGAPVTPAAP